VDDNDVNLAVARESLKSLYRVMTMASAAKMFSMLEKITPDLILLDIEMPLMDGFQALQKLKENSLTVDIPVIFLTAMTDESLEVRGFEQGVIDFITKPFSAPVLINRIKSHLDIDAIIRERTAQLQQLQNAIIFSFADLVETRDENTGGHVERTAAYIKILVDEMARKKIYADEINKFDMELFVSSARLHDVGKISISDLILNKPGKLTTKNLK
jgi:putative two-component system response regulator